MKSYTLRSLRKDEALSKKELAHLTKIDYKRYKKIEKNPDIATKKERYYISEVLSFPKSMYNLENDYKPDDFYKTFKADKNHVMDSFDPDLGSKEFLQSYSFKEKQSNIRPFYILELVIPIITIIISIYVTYYLFPYLVIQPYEKITKSLLNFNLELVNPLFRETTSYSFNVISIVFSVFTVILCFFNLFSYKIRNNVFSYIVSLILSFVCISSELVSFLLIISYGKEIKIEYHTYIMLVILIAQYFFFIYINIVKLRIRKSENLNKNTQIKSIGVKY